MDTTGRAAAWRLRAEEHAKAAADIWADGPRRMADPATTSVGPSREMYHKEIDHLYDRMEPFKLRERRYQERAAAMDKGVFIQHQDDDEFHEFLADPNNQRAWSQAAVQGRIKVLRPGQSYALPNENKS